MCGISGIMVKREGALGNAALHMLREINHRGRDSTGAALYRERPLDRHVARLAVTRPREDVELARNVIAEYGSAGEAQLLRTNCPYWIVRLEVEVPDDQAASLMRRLNSEPSLCVHSLSRRLEVFKNIGSADDLAAFSEIASFRGKHGIGHTRLATESIDNVNFAHPFTSDLSPELTIVHNGQLTNYFNLRRRLTAKGILCKTYNDSEIIAHFLAYQMKVRGLTLGEALESCFDSFDGVYSVVVATDTEIGAIRDHLGMKPILYYEDEEILLLGSEQVCFEPVDPNVYATEMQPGEVRVWSLN